MSSSVGSLDSIIDRVNIMRKQEDGPYLYQNVLLCNDDIKLNVAWRRNAWNIRSISVRDMK